MLLSKKNIKNLNPAHGVLLPSEELFALPEKVLQFGTGVLLRGLPDYFIDKANRQGKFNGRIVVVKSTSSGDTKDFDQQDSLYTLCIRGLLDAQKVEENVIISAISRVLVAQNDWNRIIQCAHNQDLKIIISNTTEVGISLLKENILNGIPQSFPGKLLAFLLERFQAFTETEAPGFVIIPTELIPDNGKKLKSIINELAEYNQLDERFIQWVNQSNYFCSSLVDRIVPGKLPPTDKKEFEKKAGYTDDLMIMAEPYRLWAIESADKKINEILSFHKADEGVAIETDIQKFRELKLRLLNGPHTSSAGLAILAGFRTVKEAMENTFIRSYIKNLMIQEIVPAISYETISIEESVQFAGKVLDRFSNPYLEHQWVSIAVQYTSKMRMRNVPVLLNHYKQSNSVPVHMALGFAGFLFLMKSKKTSDDRFEILTNAGPHPLSDDYANYFYNKWQEPDMEQVVDSILTDTQLWGSNLAALNGFADAVKEYLLLIQEQGALKAIKEFQLNKIEVDEP